MVHEWDNAPSKEEKEWVGHPPGMYKSECLVEPGCYCSLCLLQTSLAEPIICYSIKRSCCLTKRCAWNMSQCHWSNGKRWFSVKLNVKIQAGNHWLTLHLHSPFLSKSGQKGYQRLQYAPVPSTSSLQRLPLAHRPSLLRHQACRLSREPRQGRGKVGGTSMSPLSRHVVTAVLNPDGF